MPMILTDEDLRRTTAALDYVSEMFYDKSKATGKFFYAEVAQVYKGLMFRFDEELRRRVENGDEPKA